MKLIFLLSVLALPVFGFGQNIESETIHAKITEGNFIPIKTKVKENYVSLYKNEEARVIDTYVNTYDILSIIGISSVNTDLAKVQFQDRTGFIRLKFLSTSYSENKIIEAIIKPIIEAQKKAASEKLEAQNMAEELKAKYDAERMKRVSDSIVQRLSDLRIKEAADLRIAKAKRIAKNKADEVSRQEAETKRKVNLIKSYGEVIATRLLNKEIWIGMTAQMARESIGSPVDVNRTVLPSTIKEQWVYSIKNLLYFENNILVSWQE